MHNRSTRPLVLVADDDADDRLLLSDAFQTVGLDMEVGFAENGEELLHLLRFSGDRTQVRSPHLVLLDLNMPVMDGREALRLIKADAELCSIPVVVLTTSRAQQDVAAALSSGANAFISKPGSYDGLVDMVRSLCGFWFHWCSLPETHLMER